MDYLSTARYDGYKYILETHSNENINLLNIGSYEANMRHLEIFSESIRRRFNFGGNADPDYYVFSVYAESRSHTGLIDVLLPPVIYSKKVYNNTIMNVATPHLSRVDAVTAAAYREIYRTATLREPARRGWFDLYLHKKTLTLVKDDCEPGALNGPTLVHIYPAVVSDLPHYYRAGRLAVTLYGVRFDGKCLMQATLPGFDIARIVVGGIGEIVPDDYLPKLRRQYAALQETAPAIRSEFAVYAEDGALRYIKSECNPDHIAAPFYLHIIPADTDNLPAMQREHGFDNHDFHWDDLANPDWADLANRGSGILFDDKCMVTVKLPDYEIHGVRTGQHIPGARRLWSGEFYTDAYYAARASELAAPAVGKPAAAGFFSVYHGDSALTYIREDCAPADTEAMFYLHLFPADVNDLTEGQREHGFDNRDFEFGSAGGVQYEGRCLVSIPLPDYAIDRIHTGKYRPESGRLWAAEFAVAVGPRKRQ